MKHNKNTCSVMMPRKLLLPIFATLFFALLFASHEAVATDTSLSNAGSCAGLSPPGSWNSLNSTCTVSSLTVNSGDTLTITGHKALTIIGLTYNAGTIVENGILTNEGAFTNSGNITNNGGGTITNKLGAAITDNYRGLIFNIGTISNSGSIYKTCLAVFENYGVFTGNSVIIEPCPGYTKLEPPSIGNNYNNQYGGGIKINGKPFDIKNYATTIPQQVLQIGTPATFDFKIYSNRGGYTVQHVSMYFPFKRDPSVINSDTWISWDKTKGVDVHDPQKIFSKSTVDVKTEGSYFYVTFTMTPQKTTPDSSLIMRMWDDKLSAGDVPIWGAIVIVDPNAPVAVKKIPTDQYGDYVTLENILDKDGYYIPTLLNKLHALDTDKSVDINWVYDKGVDKLTMVESDKSGNILGEIVCNLQKKESQPTVTDHDYVYIPEQLNRMDSAQEKAAMNQEAQKAEKILESIPGLARWFCTKITLSATANSILDAFRYAEPSQLYVYDPTKEQEAKKLDEYKADKILESMGVKLEAYAWR